MSRDRAERPPGDDGDARRAGRRLPPIGAGTPFERFWNAVTYLYVLRVPLITWALLVALPFAALPRNSSAAPLLRGLFDIVDPALRWRAPAFLFVTLASLMAAATVGVTARLILCDGADRFDIVGPRLSAGIELALRLVPAIAAASIVAGAWWQSVPVVGWFSAIAGTVLGIAAFFVLMTTVHPQLRELVFRSESAVGPATTPAPRLTLVSWLGAAAAGALFHAVAALVRRTPHGFVGRDGRLRARHAFAFLQFLLSLALYAGLWIFKADWNPLIPGGAPRVPTLCLILVLVLLVCWGLTALSFLLDRFRIPVLSLLLAYGAVASVFPQTDHYFQSLPLAPQADPLMIPASEVLGRRSGQPAVVVAATGGGIQAAAWTARVLAGIQKDAQACGSDFDRALVAISSVSGGSVGAMYLLDSYRDGRIPAIGALDDDVAVKAAQTSSLDEIAWGLVYPDLVWAAVPFLKGIGLFPPTLVNGSNLTSDRGSALEDTWKRQGTGLAAATLATWRADLARGARPAVLFNATVAETGDRMIIGTSSFEWEGLARQEFSSYYSGYDVPITTAARLSATFPYVSPAARILRHGVFENEYHLVDGGYYDNYGTATLIEWLDQGLRSAGSEQPRKVLMLQIRSAPVEAPPPPSARRGWIFDLLQPLSTLFAVRGAGQLSHSDIDVDLIEREQYGNPPVPVQTVVIQFPSTVSDTEAATSPPLSWHLTPGDRARLRDAWPRVRKGRQAVQEFLGVSDASRCVE